MPRTVKTLDPHKAKTRVYDRKGVKPRFEVGETYLYKRQRMDGKGEFRTLVTVIDRKEKGKSVTIAVIAVTSHKPHNPKVCEAATGLCCPRTNEVGRRRIVAVVEGIRKGKQGNLLDLTVHDQIVYKGEVRRMTYTMRGVRCQRCRHRGDREMTIVVGRNTYYGWWLDSSRMVAVGG
jgi:hypothetical protein